MHNTPPLSLPPTDMVNQSPFFGDLLSRKDLAASLTLYLDRLKAGAVLAIDAEWGEGKTWFGQNWAVQLKNDGHKVVFIDAFEQDYIEDPFLLIAAEIAEILKDNPKADSFVKKASGVMNILLPFATKTLINTIGEMTLGKADLSDKINNKITDKLSEIKSQMKSIQVEPEPDVTYIEPNVTTIDNTKPLAMTIHEEISQEIKQELKQEVKQNIKEEVRQDINAIFEMQQSIKILSRNCLDIHAKVLRRVRTKFMNDEMTELQVATVLSKMGFTLGTLRDIAEMGNSSKVNNNIQINNDNQQQHATIRLVR